MRMIVLNFHLTNEEWRNWVIAKISQLEVGRARIQPRAHVGHKWAILLHSKGWQYMTQEMWFFLWTRWASTMKVYAWCLSFSEALITNVYVLILFYGWQSNIWHWHRWFIKYIFISYFKDFCLALWLLYHTANCCYFLHIILKFSFLKQ